MLDKAKAALGLASDKADEGAATAQDAARTASGKASANYDAAKRSASDAASTASGKAGRTYQATKNSAADTAGAASDQVRLALIIQNRHRSSNDRSQVCLTALRQATQGALHVRTETVVAFGLIHCHACASHKSASLCFECCMWAGLGIARQRLQRNSNAVRQADGILGKAKAALGLASDKVSEGADAADSAARTATGKASGNYDAAKRSASGAAADASDRADGAYRATKDAAADTADSASQEVNS